MSLGNALKTSVRTSLYGTPAYLPLRAIYQGLFNRDCVRSRQARQRFFRQFVTPGSLVFDVGANVGEYSHTFLSLGARVVAMEPNPACCAAIRALGHKGRLTVRCEAVGDRQGIVALFVGAHSGHSTVSEQWMETAAKSDPGFRWDRSIEVAMNTLDNIQQEHGTPDFVKIDVEGYEAGVLRGMSFRPSFLSFEFHACAREDVRECLDLPLFRSGCELNVVIGDASKFAWPEWRDKSAVLDYLSTVPNQVFGDIYARFNRP